MHKRKIALNQTVHHQQALPATFRDVVSAVPRFTFRTKPAAICKLAVTPASTQLDQGARRRVFITPHIHHAGHPIQPAVAGQVHRAPHPGMGLAGIDAGRWRLQPVVACLIHKQWRRIDIAIRGIIEVKIRGGGAHAVIGYRHGSGTPVVITVSSIGGVIHPDDIVFQADQPFG